MEKIKTGEIALEDLDNLFGKKISPYISRVGKLKKLDESDLVGSE